MRRALPLLVLVASCVSGAGGEIRGSGGPVPDWTMRPNRCSQGAAGILGQLDPFAFSGIDLDMYFAGRNARDTEVVVRPSDTDPSVLVRIPGRHQMVVLRRPDCSVLDIRVAGTGYAVNDEQGIEGSVHLDCARPEIGHVTGAATFTCF